MQNLHCHLQAGPHDNFKKSPPIPFTADILHNKPSRAPAHKSNHQQPHPLPIRPLDLRRSLQPRISCAKLNIHLPTQPWQKSIAMAPQISNRSTSSNRYGEIVGRQTNILASAYCVDASSRLTGFHYSTTGAGGMFTLRCIPQHDLSEVPKVTRTDNFYRGPVVSLRYVYSRRLFASKRMSYEEWDIGILLSFLIT